MLITFFAENVLSEPRPADQAHLLRIKEAEIHRFADVAIRFGPCFADLENLQRRKFVATAMHDVCSALKQSAARFE